MGAQRRWPPGRKQAQLKDQTGGGAHWQSCMMSNHEQREPDFGPGDAPGGRSQSDGGPGCTWGGLALAQELSQVQIAAPSKSRSHGHSTLSWMWSLLRKLCPHGRTQLSASARLSKLEDGAVHKFKSSKPPHSSRWLNITVKTTPTGPQMHNLFFLVSLFTGSSSTLARLLLIILLKLFLFTVAVGHERIS